MLVTQVLDKKYFSQIKDYVIKNSIKKDVLIIKDLRYSKIQGLYRNSEFYIFSSYCEVFGFTSLEAMANKCPVLISKTSSLQEINGNNVLYFDPDNILDIKKKIHRILTDKSFKKKLIQKGINHSKKFSWEKCVKETIKQIEKT